VHCGLKSIGIKAIVKVKSLSLSHITRGQEWTLQNSTYTGLLKTERGSFGQMRPKSIDLAQTAESGLRKRRVRV
jgi:hypothetical protein